jgi:hypothetical protein
VACEEKENGFCVKNKDFSYTLRVLTLDSFVQK